MGFDKIRLSLFLLFVVFITGCTSAPLRHDVKTEEVLYRAAMSADRFYVELLLEEPQQRNYHSVVQHYMDLEVILNHLYLRSQINQMDAELLDMVRRISNFWQRIKTRHLEKDEYKTEVAERDRKRLEKMFAYVLKGEGGKPEDDIE